ncbi:MAG: hypothetical protein JO053_15155 [Acidobacteria bacterium]|nr:hypothetical protein [Acidobacteriota bacterium]
MIRNIISVIALVGCVLLLSSLSFGQKKNRKIPRVCGNPEAACKGRSNFQSYELPVEWPVNSVIAESEPFYAIILKSAKYDFTSATDCAKVYTDEEIQSIQNQFPTNKVFALKCADTGYNYYTGIATNVVFIAVYAGRTLAESNKFLAKVKALNEFPGIKLRRMKVGVNGT